MYDFITFPNPIAIYLFLCNNDLERQSRIYKGEIIMKKWYKAFAVMGACAFMLGTMSVASADEYEGYDENGNYVYAVTDEQGNVAVAVADEDGNYAVHAEDADGNYYQEWGEY